MTYFVYVHRQAGGVPHFEVLPEMPETSAVARAGALLAQRADGERAEVWLEDVLVQTVVRPAFLGADAEASAG